MPPASSVHNSLVSAAVRPGSRRLPSTTVTMRSSARRRNRTFFVCYIIMSHVGWSKSRRTWVAVLGLYDDTRDGGTGAASLYRRGVMILAAIRRKIVV